MKKLSTFVIPLFTAFAMAGPGSAAAQPGEPCEIQFDLSWGCEDNAGWASISEITGAVTPTSILWSSGATVQFVTGLPAGDHWVQVTDAEGCMVQEEFTVYCTVSPDCMLDADLDWGCLSPTSGWASIENITGATEPTTILWSTGATTQFVSDIPNGDHWVVVWSGEDCWVKQYFSVNCWISPDCELGATVDWGCFDTTSAWASVDISGAMNPTSILWSTGDTVQFITGLTNGDHWVMISEAEDCWVKTPFTVSCEMDPDCPLEVMVDHGCTTEGEGWASIEELIGGNADTEVHWSTGDTTMSVTGLTSGSYYVVVMNSETCWLKEHFEIDCDSDCALDATIDWGCNSTTSGWASVSNITGAGGTTSILWSTGETTAFAADLPNGDHWVTISDSEGCSITEEFSVNCWVSPDCELGATVEWGCFDTTSAWASVMISGAMNPTSILWSTGDTVQYVTGLTNGDHWVMVSEAEDCWVKTGFTISCEMDPDCALDITFDHGCIGDAPGYAVIEEIFGGTGTTEVHWSTGDTTMGITGLTSGAYFVVVMNSETCWLKEHFDIECDLGMILYDPEMEVQTFPMPASDVLNVEIESVKSGVVSLVLTDAIGRILMTHGNEAFQAGEQRTITLGTGAFDNGSYTLAIARDGQIITTQRVIISR